MLIDLIRNIGNVIGINKITGDGTKSEASSDKKPEASSEDSLCDISFLSSEGNEKGGIFGKISTALKKVVNIIKNPIKYIKGVLGQEESPKGDYSGLSGEVIGTIGQIEMDKMPKQVSLTVSEVSEMFKKNSPFKVELEQDGIREYVETFDKSGRKTGSYEVMRYYTGEIEITCKDYDKDGNVLGGQGITIRPDDEIVESYTLVADGQGWSQPLCTYYYSFDGTCVDALNDLSFVQE